MKRILTFLVAPLLMAGGSFAASLNDVSIMQYNGTFYAPTNVTALNDGILGLNSSGVLGLRTTITGMVSITSTNFVGGGAGLTALNPANITGSTTVGRAILSLANPGAITFVRINADNSVMARSAADFKTDLALTSADVGLSAVTNDAQTKAAIVPNTAPSAGQILVGTGSAYLPRTITGFFTLDSAGLATVQSDIIPLSSLVNATAGSRLIGRQSGTAGSWSEITLGTNLAMSVGGVLSASGITALTGDGTASGTGSVTFTLATVNANVGTFGSNTKSAVTTVNGKGLVTAVTESTITPAVGSITGFGIGVGAALAVNVGSAGAPVLFNGALGTPSSGVGTNLTALTAANITASTTVGRNILNLTNPSAITFLRMNADNSVDALSASAFRTAIGAGSGGGDTVAPATNTDLWFPRWNGANSKTLSDGVGGSTGGNGAPDAGKVLLFDASGGFRGNFIECGTLGAYASFGVNHQVGYIDFNDMGWEEINDTPGLESVFSLGDNYTGSRAYITPDASGTVALVATTAPYISGFVVTSNTSDATNDIDISTGMASSATSDDIISLATALVKQQDAVWAAGTNAGGMYQSANLSGTVTTVGTTAIVGTSTSFLTDFVVGDVIATAGGRVRRITVVTDDTHMTAESAMATETAVTYKRGGKAPNTAYYVYAIKDNAADLTDVFFTTRNPSQTVVTPTATGSFNHRLIGMFHNNGTPAINGVSHVCGDGSWLGTQVIDYTNATNANVDTGLCFYAGANETWGVVMHAVILSPAAGNRQQITAPAGGTIGGIYSLVSVVSTAISLRITAINTLQTLATGATTFTQLADFAMVNGSTAGTVSLGLCSVTNTQTTTMYALSWFKASR